MSKVQDRAPSDLLKNFAPRMAEDLKSYVAFHHARLENLINSSANSCGFTCAHEASRIYDGMLSAMFLAIRAILVHQDNWQEVSLAAVGSYGRGAMGLHSDLDVRLLCYGSPDQMSDLAEAMLYPLWNMRMPVGHQVVGIDQMLELAQTNLPTATTLLDWRSVHDDERIGDLLLTRAYQELFTSSGVDRFISQLEADTHARHDRYGASVYLLEPEIKHGAGGMRDLDIAFWVARARWKVRRLSDLTKIGILVPKDLAEISEASEHLWRVRNHLHLAAGRRSDRLSFEMQERVAELLGYGADREGVERFMSMHYQHATSLSRAREQIVSRALERPKARQVRETILADGIKLMDHSEVYVSESTLRNAPIAALRVYAEAVRRDAALSASSRTALRRTLQSSLFQQALRESGETGPLFLQLCTTIKVTRLRSESILSDMHDVGLLASIIPEFAPLVGRVHHDVYHVLTVDMHSIAAVDFLRKLTRGEFAASYPLPSRLAAEVARPRVLFLAALVHDIGKAIGRPDHATRGAEIAKSIAIRLGLEEEFAAAVEHLVRHHLRLYHFATRRDLADPSVIDEVLRIAAGREGLRELFLLTFADVFTTNPEAMTAWKAKLLEDLFLAADARLRGESIQNSDPGLDARKRIADLSARFGNAPQLVNFLQSMPERYILGTSGSKIRDHAMLVHGRPLGSPVVGAFPDDRGDAVELCVVADDRPGLLAAIAAVFSANHLSVLQSQIHSRNRADGASEAVDIFTVRTAGEDVSNAVHARLAKLQRDLVAVLSRSLSPDDLVRPAITAARSSRRTPAVETELSIDNRASPRHTVIEVLTEDRPRLLYLLASCLRDLELTIQLAKINTEGTRVADVFYVCETNGSKVSHGERTALIASQLKSILTSTSQ